MCAGVCGNNNNMAHKSKKNFCKVKWKSCLVFILLLYLCVCVCVCMETGHTHLSDGHDIDGAPAGRRRQFTMYDYDLCSDQNEDTIPEDWKSPFTRKNC